METINELLYAAPVGPSNSTFQGWLWTAGITVCLVAWALDWWFGRDRRDGR